MSDFECRALTILYERIEMSADEFADRLWPDSLGHKRMSNAGQHGSRRGHGMTLAAGSYLGKLRKLGLVEVDRSTPGARYRLTGKGTVKAQSYMRGDNGETSLSWPKRCKPRGFLGIPKSATRGAKPA